MERWFKKEGDGEDTEEEKEVTEDDMGRDEIWWYGMRREACLPFGSPRVGWWILEYDIKRPSLERYPRILGDNRQHQLRHAALQKPLCARDVKE